MTVLASVLKTLLIDVLSKKRQESQVADTKPSYFITRNRDLSEEKQEFLRELISSISQLSEHDPDSIFMDNLRICIEICKNKCSNACEKNKYSPQTTEQMLDGLIKFIDMFRTKAETLKLLNISNEMDALGKFTYVVVAYHANRLLDNARSGVVDGFFKSPAISSANAFLQEVDRHVIEAFIFSNDMTEGLDQKNHDEYLRRKNLFGVSCLRNLELEYNQCLGKFPVVSKVVPSHLGELLCMAGKTIITDNPVYTSAGKAVKLDPAETRVRDDSNADDETIYDGAMTPLS